MSVDFNRGFDIDGPIVLGELAFYTGPLAPYDIPITNAPVDSVYIQSNGSIWAKVSTGDLAADWNAVITANPVIITITDTDYTVAAGIGYVRVKAITKDIYITIPTATVERVLTIKVVVNPSDKYDVWLITPDASLIEDEDDAVIQCKGTSVTLHANGTDWEIV